MEQEDESVKKAIDVLRQEGLRRRVSFTLLDEKEFWVGIAENQEDLQEAFSLLHDCYVGYGIMDPHPSGLRCNLYQALPYTTTIVIKHQNKVIGTIALIKDSTLGFPSDKSYKIENDFFRRKDYTMVEVSALAVHKDYRNLSHKISFPLMKFAAHYSIYYMNATMMVATVHPRSKDFYAGLFGFNQNGEIIKYEFANGALAIHLTMELQHAESWMEKTYRGLPEKSNVYRYFFELKDPILHFPNRATEAAVDIIMNPELLKYFFVTKTEVFKNASIEELASVRSAYLQIYDLSQIPYLCDAHPSHAFRYPTRISAAWLSQEKLIVGSIFDITGYGAFFATTEDISNMSGGELVFNLGDKLFRIQSVVARKNGVTNSHYPKGLGVQFIMPQHEIIQIITGCASIFNLTSKKNILNSKIAS